MTATIELKGKLGAFIKYYHNNATKSCWLRVHDHPSENPDDKTFIDPLALLDKEAKNEQDKLRSLDKLSLRHQMGRDEDTYCNMMIKCNWILKKNYNNSIKSMQFKVR